MRIIKNTMRGALVVLLALGLWVGSASAQNELKLNQVGAALALPLLGDENGQAITYLTITNVGPEDRNLHFNVIKGNGWDVVDFDCPVTASETVLIRWLPQGGGSYLFVAECNLAGTDVNPPNFGFVTRLFNWDRGILFVSNETEECGDGTCTTTENDLFGDFVVVNPGAGVAYSAGAVPFQGIDPMGPGLSDRDYMFDNNEYAMFPATLATNFIAPGQNLGGTVGAELVLFVLDGRANIGSQASLEIVFYDDEETPTSARFTFDCFTVVPLTNINPNFAAPLLGSETGHMYMNVIDADQRSNVHDNKFGNGNAIRVVGVHGWLVQTIVIAQGEQLVGVGGWSRTLSQGMLPQDLDGDDVPTFDGL